MACRSAPLLPSSPCPWHAAHHRRGIRPGTYCGRPIRPTRTFAAPWRCTGSDAQRGRRDSTLFARCAPCVARAFVAGATLSAADVASHACERFSRTGRKRLCELAKGAIGDRTRSRRASLDGATRTLRGRSARLGIVRRLRQAEGQLVRTRTRQDDTHANTGERSWRRNRRNVSGICDEDGLAMAANQLS